MGRIDAEEDHVFPQGLRRLSEGGQLIQTGARLRVESVGEGQGFPLALPFGEQLAERDHGCNVAVSGPKVNRAARANRKGSACCTLRAQGPSLSPRGIPRRNPQQADPFVHPARSKVTDYLLVRQARGDKSALLERAGYSALHPDRLINDLMRRSRESGAELVEENQFGRYYEVVGTLNGPAGVKLGVKTIWMSEHLSGVTKFITLIPSGLSEK